MINKFFKVTRKRLFRLCDHLHTKMIRRNEDYWKGLKEIRTQDEEFKEALDLFFDDLHETGYSGNIWSLLTFDTFLDVHGFECGRIYFNYTVGLLDEIGKDKNKAEKATSKDWIAKQVMNDRKHLESLMDGALEKKMVGGALDEFEQELRQKGYSDGGLKSNRYFDRMLKVHGIRAGEHYLGYAFYLFDMAKRRVR